MIVVWLFLAVPWVCLQFVIVVFSDNTHLLFCCTQLNVLFSTSSLVCRLAVHNYIYYFLHILLCVGAALSSSLSSVTLPSELTVGTSYPSGVSMERACGDVTGVVSQDNNHRMER